MTAERFIVNFDGLIGPTHNYAGLSLGNIASIDNKNTPSHPKKAAQQGLDKMRFLMDLGIKQAVFPPHQRPLVSMLRRLGFRGSDEQVVTAAFTEAPYLLASCSSASSMWAANVATASPSADTADKKLHFTPANLITMFHRYLETPLTEKMLHHLFRDTDHFVIHSPLPPHPLLGDEGSANHMRLHGKKKETGVEIFVYGSGTSIYPARQQLEACQATVRRHLLHADHVVFAMQHPEAIDKGIFHNDVIAVGCGNFLFCHEKAYQNIHVLDEIKEKYRRTCGEDLFIEVVEESVVPLEDAVSSYLFNSQLVERQGGLALIAPEECKEFPAIVDLLEKWKNNPHHPVKEIYFFDVRESMRNGGGPACLRMPVPMTSLEFQAMHQGVILTPSLYDTLSAWIDKHYREELHPSDLGDPHLVSESNRALDHLTQILKLGALYDFQR